MTGEPGVNYLCHVEHPGYLVGDDGGVWSCWTVRGLMGTRWRRLAPGRKKDGYLVYRLRVAPQVYRSRHGHSLVLAAFRSPRPPGAECRHLDGDPGNNRLENLAWGTGVENYRDRVAHGTHLFGSRVASAKFTEGEIKEVRRDLARRVPMRVLARRFGVRPMTIADVATGKTWSRVSVDA